MLKANEKVLLDKVVKYPKLEAYFFDKLVEKKDIKWLEPLKQRGFFGQERIPRYTEGSFLYEWKLLNYVDSIIDGLVANNEIDDINYILEVLLQAASISKNSRIFTQSLKIITKLPLEMLNYDYAKQFLCYWVNCQENRDYIFYELATIFLPYIIRKDNSESVLTIKTFIENIPEENFSYILDYILDNKDLLKSIIQINDIEMCKSLMTRVEPFLYVQSSERNIDNNTLRIDNYNSFFTLSINSIVCLRGDFKTREKDIAEIKKTIRQNIGKAKPYLIDRIAKLLYGDLFIKDAFTSIYERDQYLFDFEDYLTELIKNVLIYGSEDHKLFEILFRSKYDLLVKLALFLVNIKFDNLRDLFLNLVRNKDKTFDYVLRYYIFSDEIKHIFEMLDQSTEADVIRALNAMIDKGEYIKHDKSTLSQFKLARYNALKGIDYFNNKYQDGKPSTGSIELVPPLRFSGVHTVKDKSPLSSEDILSLSTNELVKIMRNFREDNRFPRDDFTKITYNGFGNELKIAFKANPKIFLNDLTHFNNVQYEFIVCILDAINELILEKQVFDYYDYNKILTFLDLYTDSDSFWQDEFRFEENKTLLNHKTFLKRLFRFFTQYLSNDNLKFTEKEYSIILNIIARCIDNEDLAKIEQTLYNNHDFAFYSLNSLGGVLNRCILELSLKIKRISLSNHTKHWQQDLQPKLETLLSAGNIDCYYVFGEFIANYSYIDKPWVTKILDGILTGSSEWEYFMTGYLNNGVIYGEYYCSLKNHYMEALTYEFIDKDVRKRIGTHIIIGYLNGFEEHNQNEILDKVFEIWDLEILEFMVRYCFSIDKKNFVEGITRDHILNGMVHFWNKVYEKYNNQNVELTNRDIQFVGHTTQMINNFDYIDTYLDRNLRFVYKFLGNFQTYYVIDYFVRLIRKPIDAYQKPLLTDLIHQLFIECIPSFPQDKIIILLEYLKQNEQPNRVNDILKTYIENTQKSFVVEFLNH